MRTKGYREPRIGKVQYNTGIPTFTSSSILAGGHRYVSRSFAIVALVPLEKLRSDGGVTTGSQGL